MRLSWFWRWALVATIAAGGQAPSLAEEQKLFLAGPYSFSDELGGFRILSAAGFGTRDEPIVVTEELASASPVTMVIRTARPIRTEDRTGYYANGTLYLRIVAINASGHPWVEFEFELQEQINEPSTFGDGLSFDQRREEAGNIRSDRYAGFSRDFEPYDRLLFRNGQVDPRASVSMDFLVTDFTPRMQFYLVQDPRIPIS